MERFIVIKQMKVRSIISYACITHMCIVFLFFSFHRNCTAHTSNTNTGALRAIWVPPHICRFAFRNVSANALRSRLVSYLLDSAHIWSFELLNLPCWFLSRSVHVGRNWKEYQRWHEAHRHLVTTAKVISQATCSKCVSYDDSGCC